MEIPENVRHIHLVAVCGTGMGSLAGLFKEKGFHITGSDQNTYPPMSTELENLGIKLFEGYKPQNLYPKPDLVIVGNAVSKNNPEIEEVLRLGIPYLSMPQAVSRFFLTGKKSIVVTGTHGKTTVSALLSHLLLEVDSDPSFLFGGVMQNGEKNYRKGSGPYFVIEGDEYDTAFFDKGPKFLHYLPFYTLITSLEFDHADIYKDLDHITSSFEALVKTTNPNGLILACNHYPALTALLLKSKAKTETYGLGNTGGWSAKNISYGRALVTFDIFREGKKETTLKSPLAGKHNVLNVLASYTLLRLLGIASDKIGPALSTFGGVRRRQEIRGVVGDVVIIDDFAHHPTAILETIDAVRKKFEGYRLWAVFEPRSNTSIRNVFQKEFVKVFRDADFVVLADVFRPEKVKDGKILDVDRLAEDINRDSMPGQARAVHISGVDSIIAHIVKNISPHSVILIMSNGGFGGIHEKLLVSLKSVTECTPHSQNG